MQVLMENVGKMLILKLLLGLKPLLDKTGGVTIQFPKTLQKIHYFSFVSSDCTSKIKHTGKSSRIQKAFLAAAYPVSRKLR